MKKIITAALCLFSLMANAQIKPTSPIAKPVYQKPQRNTGTQQTPTTSQTPASTPAVNDADYFLAVSKMIIRTGNDNKDRGAKLILRTYPVSGNNNYRRGYCLENYTAELKKWTRDEIPLPRAAEFDQSFNSLANYKQTGIMVDIYYDTWGGPFPLLDAWRIEEVSVTLEFKNKNGQPHPTMGTKTIIFPGSNQLLNFADMHLFCQTDQYFNPLPPFVTKRPL